MKCRTVYRFICEHLDEPSRSKRFHAVSEHMSRCAMCRRMLSSLKKTVELYCAEPEVKVPPAAHRKLMSALKAERRSTGK
jgi:predicted anti-sigma-YlaC factor YlaD